MENPENLESLVEKARGGNPDAKDSLARLSAERVQAWIRAGLGGKLERKASEDDFVQEAFLQMFKEIGQLRWEGEAAFWAWLKRIAINVIHGEAKHLGAKKRSPDRLISLQEEIRSSGGSPEMLENLVMRSGVSPSKSMNRAERFGRLESAFRSLRTEYREVILLASVRRVPMREVAERMDRSVPAANMLLWRAMKALGKAFGKIDSTESAHLPHDRSLAGQGDEP